MGVGVDAILGVDRDELTEPLYGLIDALYCSAG
jgi:hypothetical protein